MRVRKVIAHELKVEGITSQYRFELAVIGYLATMVFAASINCCRTPRDTLISQDEIVGDLGSINYSLGFKREKGANTPLIL